MPLTNDPSLLCKIFSEYKFCSERINTKDVKWKKYKKGKTMSGRWAPNYGKPCQNLGFPLQAVSNKAHCHFLDILLGKVEWCQKGWSCQVRSHLSWQRKRAIVSVTNIEINNPRAILTTFSATSDENFHFSEANQMTSAAYYKFWTLNKLPQILHRHSKYITIISAKLIEDPPIHKAGLARGNYSWFI